MEDYSRIQRYDSVRRREQRVDVEFLDAWLLHDKLAEADKQFFELAEIDRRAAADAPQGAVNLSPFHHASRKSAVERWQAEGSIPKHFNQLTAGPKEQHWAKLRINAAAENQ